MNAPHQMQMPAALANRQRRSLMDDVATGLGVQRPAHISIAGGKFHIVNRAGQKYLVPTHHIDIIFMDVNPNSARLFFDPDKPYDPGSSDPPLCFSDNGTGPSKDSMEPQAPTCTVCPWNVRGSDTTFTGKPTTACDKRKKFGVIFLGQQDVEVYDFTIPPGSLGNLKAYTDWLKQQASGGDRPLDIADMITRVEWDPQRPFVMNFRSVGWADDPHTLALLQHIDDNHLSDAAVNRHDVAMDPAVVTQLLANRGQAPALAAPVAPQAPQQYQLPPRTPGVAAPPTYQPPGPAAPQFLPTAQQFNPQDQFLPPGMPSAAPTPEPPKTRKPRAPNKPKAEAGVPQQAPFTGGPAAWAQGAQPQTAGPAWNPQPAPPAQPAGGFTAAMPPIPAFLQRSGLAPPSGPGTRLQEAPGENPAPSFGMATPGAPPPGVASALDAAMQLPPRPRG